ncbi:sensor histidine kinase [Paenibacillus sp. 598K]|uniref:sensor histidine kinase n=1 Tax=Paenibacillus sp. 598K TaxID=1117987 RepID=UPI0026B63820|nr:histidine kinase [Paenibacillus sp. 598K]
MFKFPAIRYRKSIFMRLVVTYVLVIMPIIMLGFYLYQWNYKSATEDISRATNMQLERYLDELQREVEWMGLQQFDILEDDSLNKLAVMWSNMDAAEQRERLNYVANRLTSFKNSSAFIRDIYVHIRTMGKTVSASNAINDFDAERFTRFDVASIRRENRLIRWGDTLHMSAAKFSGRRAEPPLFIVQIELDAEGLRESLQQVHLYPESGAFLLSERSGFALTSDPDSAAIVESYLAVRQSPQASSALLELEGVLYRVDQAYSDSLGLTIATYLPEETVRRPLAKFYNWAWVFAIASLMAIVLISYSTYRLIHRPLLLLVQSFKRMEGGALNIRIKHEPQDEFGYLYHRFNHMLKKLQSLIDQDFKQKMMMQRAELKQLQSQINPHFLYNSFFILNSLAKTGDVERIEQFTDMLGEYFRFITRNGEDHVPLSEEVRHSRMYTEIQKLRFSRRIQVRFDELPEAMASIRVPRLIIQPIIENAYEHSLEKVLDEGLLRVTFEEEAGSIGICIENNGEAVDEDTLATLRHKLAHPTESYEMTGIMNIHRRLLLTFGEGSGLQLSRSELGGLKVVIRIRLEEGI